MTVKNKRKIACFGFSTKDKIGSATKGNPKLITPLTNPPKDIAKSISRIEFKSRCANIAETFHKYHINTILLFYFLKIKQDITIIKIYIEQGML